MGKNISNGKKEYHRVCYDGRPSLAAADNVYFRSTMSDCNKRLKQSKADLQKIVEVTEELEASPLWINRWLGKMSRKYIIPFCDSIVRKQIAEYRTMKSAVNSVCKIR